MSVADPKFNPSGSPVITALKMNAEAQAEYIEANIPPGRRRSIALTQLEQATMWAVKAAAVGDD